MNTTSKADEISLPQSPDWVERVKEKAFNYMSQYGNCTQCILAAFMEELGIEDPMVIRSAGAMQGGMLSSLTCGVHTAAIMVLGLMMGRERLEQGHDGMIPIVMPAQELMHRINSRLGGHSCQALSGVDFTDLNQAMAFMGSEEYNICLSRVGDGTEETALFLKELDEKGELFRIKG
jgi:C_GCAxxG_C_C family probable redox protein